MNKVTKAALVALAAAAAFVAAAAVVRAEPTDHVLPAERAIVALERIAAALDDANDIAIWRGQVERWHYCAQNEPSYRVHNCPAPTLQQGE